ncbi:MAG: 2-dehydropantoate 2-reductase [Oleiphilaceae bacterium]|nr:2-dehydropantoate 2-reductase [Oleiphilaceae bacterium]
MASPESSVHRPDPPVCLVLGAGALGRLWAAYLPDNSRGFIPRKRDQTGHCRYALVTPTGEIRPVNVPWRQPASPDIPDCLLVTTKAQDTLTALTDVLQHLLPQTPIVLFQNGMGSQQVVAAQWPDRPVLAAVTTEGANRPDADTLIHAGLGETWVGGLNPAGCKAQSRVVTALASSGLIVHSEPDIAQRLLRKLAVNAGINPFTAIIDCPNGDILKQPFYLEHIDELCREIAALMHHKGWQVAASELRQQIEQVARTTAKNTSSMRSDIINGRVTEIRFINGWIAQECQRHHLPSRVNHMLTTWVQDLSAIA